MRKILVSLVTLTVLLPAALTHLGAAEPLATESPTNPYPGWAHTGSFYILTTPEGADLPTSASEDGFPLLVRLHRGFFDFGQAQAHGEDVRFSTPSGIPLAYQVEDWDPAAGTAALWVRIPNIRGQARQEIRLHWGKANATSESSGAAVFNASNGYLGVWHMNEPVRDEVGRLPSKDVGTAHANGMIGAARHLAGGQGIVGGENIAHFPTGADSHSSEVWFRAEKPNATLLGWGNEHAQGKVVMQFRSPPHLNMDCYFSGANVRSGRPLPLAQWHHVVHTYEKGNSRLYVNGQLDGVSTSTSSPLAIRSPAGMWIGGWHGHYDFVGDLDEVRVSKVARSANWARLQYENQRPMQTLVGPLMTPGEEFWVSSTHLTIPEGGSATASARVGGAQKIYWLLKRAGQETTVAVDQLSYTLEAGRVAGDTSLTLQFKAVCAEGIKTRDIPVTITENLPDPVFTLKAPARWDGRETIEVVPQLANLSESLSKGAADLRYHWAVSNLAVIQEIVPGKLLLKRAQGSGPMTVTLTLSNGGAEVVQSATIQVQEPRQDPWVKRAPAPEEKPEDNQFYARDDGPEGTLFYHGTLAEPADEVFLKVYAGGQLYRDERSKLPASRAYAFTVKLKAGLVHYRVEFGSRNGTGETVRHTATNLVCGDAYLINGQSNAEATDVGPEDPPFRSEWIRSFGSMAGDPDGARLRRWGSAVVRDREGGKAQIGSWGWELARRLVESQQIPICILNGAVGGTRIDQHQRNAADPEDASTIYGRLLWRVRQARLAHGIRGVLWHQGENDQGADGPTGGYGWENYRQYFVDLSAAWKEDYPNIQHYYVFQIWPKACAMGINGSDNRLREVQRTLPALFSNLHVMSTLGIQPPGGCHYPPAGYAEMARLICPLLERDHYNKVFTHAITPPDLQRASYAGSMRQEILLEFDQPVVWKDSLASQFYLDGQKGKVAAGAASGNNLMLTLAEPTTTRTITYLDGSSWKESNLLRGANGIAALTFCEVPIQP